MKPQHLIAVFLFLQINLFSNSQTQIKGIDKPNVSDSEDHFKANYNLKNIYEYQHDNLQIFLIEGETQLNNKKFITLQFALQSDLVVFHETGNVNKLKIDNISDQYVFLHAGDIIKGGKQDRTIQQDVLLPPRSKRNQVNCFCVESGRWSKRNNEDVNEFSVSEYQLMSRDLKVASKLAKSQDQVWEYASENQRKLNEKASYISGVEVDVIDQESETSLQLSLENEELNSIKKDRLQFFDKMLKEHPSANGLAYVINGELYGMDIYNNRDLFADLFPKLLDAIVFESIADYDSTRIDKRIDKNDFADFIEYLENAKSGNYEHVNEATRIWNWVFPDVHSYVFETIDLSENKWIHYNLVVASKSQPPTKPKYGSPEMRLNNR